MSDTAVLEVDDLRIRLGDGFAVSGATFDVGAGEFYGIIGESGSGASITARSIIELLPAHAEVTGTVRVCGTPLPRSHSRRTGRVSGQRLGFISSDAASWLDPLRTIGQQLSEAHRLILGCTPGCARTRTAALLSEVGISDPSAYMRRRPHELTAAARQRIAVAGALIGNPPLIVADEPTKGLDDADRRHLLTLLRTICLQRGTSVVLATENLAVIAETCDRVGVMHSGLLVEEAPVLSLFDHPQHPYTQALLSSLPHLGAAGGFEPLPGEPGGAAYQPHSCPFVEHCPLAVSLCGSVLPPERRIGASRVRCFRAGEGW